ncbi:MAG: rod shape-determining protein [Actinomycetota bacterium]
MSRDLAIDLGSANTLVFAQGRGIVLREPTLIALNERTGEVLAMGEEAWQAAAKGSDPVVTFQPLRRGAVSDFALTERLLSLALRKVGAGRLVKPRTLIAVPSNATMVERRAVEEATIQAGARQVWLIEEPIAAAIGAELPIDEPTGTFVVDIGGGTTEVAVISMGGIVAKVTIKVGGFDLDEEISRFMRTEYGMAIGERTAEQLKIAIGSASPLDDEEKAEVRGREIDSGAPKTVIVSSEEIRRALGDATRVIVEAVRTTLAETPPELAHDVLDTGIHLMGGGALLRGLDRRLASETGIPVHLVDNPLDTVCLGTAKALEEIERMRGQGLVNEPERAFR